MTECAGPTACRCWTKGSSRSRVQGGTQRDSAHTTQNGVTSKTSELFISALFPSIVLHCGGPQVPETTEGEAATHCTKRECMQSACNWARLLAGMECSCSCFYYGALCLYTGDPQPPGVWGLQQLCTQCTVRGCSHMHSAVPEAGCCGCPRAARLVSPHRPHTGCPITSAVRHRHRQRLDFYKGPGITKKVRNKKNGLDAGPRLCIWK